MKIITFVGSPGLTFSLQADEARRKEIYELQNKYGLAWERYDTRQTRCRAEWYDSYGFVEQKQFK